MSVVKYNKNPEYYLIHIFNLGVKLFKNKISKEELLLVINKSEQYYYLLIENKVNPNLWVDGIPRVVKSIYKFFNYLKLPILQKITDPYYVRYDLAKAYKVDNDNMNYGIVINKLKKQISNIFDLIINEETTFSTIEKLNNLISLLLIQLSNIMFINNKFNENYLDLKKYYYDKLENINKEYTLKNVIFPKLKIDDYFNYNLKIIDTTRTIESDIKPYYNSLCLLENPYFFDQTIEFWVNNKNISEIKYKGLIIFLLSNLKYNKNLSNKYLNLYFNEFNELLYEKNEIINEQLQTKLNYFLQLRYLELSNVNVKYIKLLKLEEKYMETVNKEISSF